MSASWSREVLFCDLEPYEVDRFHRGLWDSPPEEEELSDAWQEMKREAQLDMVEDTMRKCLTNCQLFYLQMQYLVGVPQKDIAKMYGVSTSTVSSGIQRGMKTLKKRLLPCKGGMI